MTIVIAHIKTNTIVVDDVIEIVSIEIVSTGVIGVVWPTNGSAIAIAPSSVITVVDAGSVVFSRCTSIVTAPAGAFSIVLDHGIVTAIRSSTIANNVVVTRRRRRRTTSFSPSRRAPWTASWLIIT